MVVNTVAWQREGPGFESKTGIFLHGVCMFCSCIRGGSYRVNHSMCIYVNDVSFYWAIQILAFSQIFRAIHFQASFKLWKGKWVVLQSCFGRHLWNRGKMKDGSLKLKKKKSGRWHNRLRSKSSEPTRCWVFILQGWCGEMRKENWKFIEYSCNPRAFWINTEKQRRWDTDMVGLSKISLRLMKA